MGQSENDSKINTVSHSGYIGPNDIEKHRLYPTVPTRASCICLCSQWLMVNFYCTFRHVEQDYICLQQQLRLALH